MDAAAHEAIYVAAGLLVIPMGMMAVAILRLFPVAPYSIVNAVATASRVSPRDFFAGTVIGIAPVIALAATFVDRLQAALSEPGPVSYAALAVNVTLIVVAAASVWRRFGRGDVPHLKEFNAGVIIMSSVAGRFGYANRGPYFTARWDVIGFTRTLSI